jgi:hypothetical protein
MKNKIFILVFLMTAAMSAHADISNTATQQQCSSVGTETAPLSPNNDNLWRSGGLNRSLDRQIYGVDIIAYKIKWSSGWSDWFVKGVNDLYSLTTSSSTTPGGEDARLAWIYFYDHDFIAIYCK